MRFVLAALLSRIVRYNLPASLLIGVCCIAGMCLPRVTYYDGCPWWGYVLYHFSHANVFHLALNLWGLFAFRPRWATCAVGFVSASIASLLPFCSVSLPTCGLSGFLMAAYARKYAEYRLPMWKPILVNMVFFFLPMFNWKIHIVSFLISYAIWRLMRK